MAVQAVHIFFPKESGHTLALNAPVIPDLRLAPKSPEILEPHVRPANLVMCEEIHPIGDGQLWLKTILSDELREYMLLPTEYLLARFVDGNLIASSPLLCYVCGDLTGELYQPKTTDTFGQTEAHYRCINPDCQCHWRQIPSTPRAIPTWINRYEATPRNCWIRDGVEVRRKRSKKRYRPPYYPNPQDLWIRQPERGIRVVLPGFHSGFAPCELHAIAHHDPLPWVVEYRPPLADLDEPTQPSSA